MKIKIRRRVAPPRHSVEMDGMAVGLLEKAGVRTTDLPRVVADLERNVGSAALVAAIPPKFKPFLKPARNKGSYGGRASTKSWTFARMLVLRALQKPGLRAVCVREIQKTLNQSCKQLLEDTIKAFHLESQFTIYNNYIKTPGDGVILFMGMQDHTAESIKSLEGIDIVWVEEAQTLSKNSLKLLRPTIRKEGSELWFTWNPRDKKDPVDAMFRTPGEKPPKTICLESSYKDNPWLSQELRDEIEWDKRRDPDKYAHVWGGEYERHSEARVFKNFRIEDFETPDDAAFLFGGDWGFSVDPTVLVRMFIKGRNLYIDREVYKVGCEIDHTPALFDSLDPGHPGMARQWEIITDSARPETISYMVNHGYPRCVGAKKGPDSVKEGVEFIKTYDVIIHTRCTHVEDEFWNYKFKTHPLTGEVIPVLEDKKNHVIDSVRYGLEKLRKPLGNVVEVW